VITIPQHKISKEIKSFAHKNLSEAPNVVFNISVLLLLLITAAEEGRSITSVAGTPNEDTIFYRLTTTISQLETHFWSQGKEFLHRNRKKLRRMKCYLTVDETYDSYTGYLLKKLYAKCSSKEKEYRRYIHKYKPKNGDTGSYKYLVFALVYGDKHRVLRVKALQRKEKYIDFIVETAIQIHHKINFDCVLFDRGFYNAELVEKLQQHKVPFIIRARISKTMKKIYGIYGEWKAYEYLFKDKVRTTLVLGKLEEHQWGFLTNHKRRKWVEIREIYRQRWNIENIFKATDGIQLRVATANPITRMFAVCLSFIVYNLWQEQKGKYTLLGFLKNIMIIVLHQLQKVLSYRDKLKINHPFWNLCWK